MRPEDREALRRRFGNRCAYCGVRETDIGAELTVDHFHPSSRGGPDRWENWVYACFACNTHKSDHWAPESPRRILHPLLDNLTDHIAEQTDGTLVGLTETGRFHIEQLQLNRPPLIAHRQARRRAAALEEALTRAQEQQEVLGRRVRALERALTEAERRLRSL